MTRPPERRVVVVPNYSGAGKPHKDQLRDMAESLLEHMRKSMDDPRQFKTYAESFAIVSRLLGDDLPTEQKKPADAIDISGFED
jgi:hypothetical protein